MWFLLLRNIRFLSRYALICTNGIQHRMLMSVRTSSGSSLIWIMIDGGSMTSSLFGCRGLLMCVNDWLVLHQVFFWLLTNSIPPTYILKSMTHHFYQSLVIHQLLKVNPKHVENTHASKWSILVFLHQPSIILHVPSTSPHAITSLSLLL